MQLYWHLASCNILLIYYGCCLWVNQQVCFEIKYLLRARFSGCSIIDNEFHRHCLRLDDIWSSSDLPFIRLYLPMKSISNSDHIYCGDCLPEIYSQVSPYFGEISLSQHLSQGGWSNRGPITYRFSFPLAGLSNWEVCSLEDRDPPPSPCSCRADGWKIGTPQTRAGPGSRARETEVASCLSLRQAPVLEEQGSGTLSH